MGWHETMGWCWPCWSPDSFPSVPTVGGPEAAAAAAKAAAKAAAYGESPSSFPREGGGMLANGQAGGHPWHCGWWGHQRDPCLRTLPAQPHP